MSASSQIAYWEGGGLRIANYLTGKTFAANPVTLEVIRFFFTPRTIQKALVEFRAYSRESVGRAILELIDARLLLEHGSAEWKRDTLIESTWGPWLPEGGFHFMTKDAPYVDSPRTLAEKIKTLPLTSGPAAIQEGSRCSFNQAAVGSNSRRQLL